MGKSSYIIFIIALFLASCQCEKDSNEKTIWKDTVDQTPVSIDDFSTNLKSLVKADSGIFRNVRFGNPISVVRGMEDSTTLVENGENYVNYTLHIDSLEDADVLYYFDAQGAINKIEVDIYPEGEESREEFYKEFTQYFTKKYGPPSSEIEEVKIWTVEQENLTVEMRMLGNAKVHDLQIDFREIREDGNP